MKIFTSYVILKLYLFLFNKYILWIRKSSKYLFHQCWHAQTNQCSSSSSNNSSSRSTKNMPSSSSSSIQLHNCTIQLQYIQFNFHFCPTCLKALCYAENSLSRSRVKVKVVWWWWGNLNELHKCHMEVEETIQMLRIIAQRFQQKHVNYNLVFFSRRDRDFYNLIVRDEIEICTFYISCFETRSRFVPSISRASRRDREFALSNLEFREGDEK